MTWQQIADKAVDYAFWGFLCSQAVNLLVNWRITEKRKADNDNRFHF